METIAILIFRGTVQGIYKIKNSPHERVIVIDEDNLEQSECKNVEALNQLYGFDFDSEIEYREIHDKLSQHVSSKDVNKLDIQ